MLLETDSNGFTVECTSPQFYFSYFPLGALPVAHKTLLIIYRFADLFFGFCCVFTRHEIEKA
jgi:hypothetical protein